jgi:hypothetical protein
VRAPQEFGLLVDVDKLLASTSSLESGAPDTFDYAQFKHMVDVV